MTLQFCEERIDFLALPLRMLELICSREISRPLSCCFVHMDRRIAKWPDRTLRSQLARTALLARSSLAERAVSFAVAAVVQLLASRANIAVALR